ncbi:putative pectinesterase/pectinesterase inhibitor 61 [Bienertia sinuspersici]
MEYGRIIEIIPQNRTQTQTRKSILVKYARIITLLAISIVALTIIIVVIVISKKDYKNTTTSPSPTLLCSGGLDRICRVTRYPDLCVDSLREYMNKKQLKKNNYNNNYYCYNNVIELSMDVTIEKLRKTLDYFVVEKKRFDEVNDSYQWSVHDDCVELMEDSVDLLTRTHSLMKLLASSPSSNSTTVGLYDDHQL